MKRFLLVLLFAVSFTFSSCKKEIEHWLVIQTYVNDRLPTPIYDSKKETYYLNLKVDQTITLKYFAGEPYRKKKTMQAVWVCIVFYLGVYTLVIM